MRSPSGFLRGYVIFERFSRFFRVSYSIPFWIIKAIHEKSRNLTRNPEVFSRRYTLSGVPMARVGTGKIFRPSHSGENSGSFLSKMVVKSQQIPTGTLGLSRKSRAMRAHRSARVGTTREPLSQRLENSCSFLAKIG